MEWYEDFNFWLNILKIAAPVALGLLVWCSTKRYNKTQISLAHDKMEKELFKEFNERYDQLNDSLEKIVKFDSLKILENYEEGKDLYFKLSDYFNLCAEEYYWYSKNRISEKIWISWKKGMDSWYEYPIIKEAWKEELKEYGRTAFYMTSTDRLFEKENEHTTTDLSN